MVMADIKIADYETELENLSQKLSLNYKTLQKILSSDYDQLKEIGQHERDISSRIEARIPEIEKKIESAREDVDAVRSDKDRAEKEKQKLKQEYEQINIDIGEKIRERDELKELLAQAEQRVEEKRQQMEHEEHKHKEKISNIEKGMLLYQSHLGLRLQRTRHNTLVFTFTQIDRMDPEKEYLLELTLEENNYHLIKSEPPLPNLKELEEGLNASNNLSGCFVHIRKLFQKMGE